MHFAKTQSKIVNNSRIFTLLNSYESKSIFVQFFFIILS